MRRQPFVDRHKEIRAFTSLLRNLSSETRSIWLIEDESGKGKTRLLQHYRDHCQDNNVSVALVDLKGGWLTPDQVLFTIRADLHLIAGRYEQHVVKRSGGVVAGAGGIAVGGNVEGGIISGDSNFQVNIVGFSHDEQVRRWAIDAFDFLYDLNNRARSGQGPFVLLFDTFEDANLDTKIWITHHVLRMAMPNRVSGVVIVLAGKQVPDPSGEWEQYHKKRYLEPVGVEHWKKYAAAVRSILTPEQIELHYAKVAANSGEMAKMIMHFTKQGTAYAE